MKKRKRTLPELSTSSLPDIVFMLLFFFMVTTVVRDEESALEIDSPTARHSEQIDQSNLTSTVLVGYQAAQNLPAFEMNGERLSLKEAAHKLLETRHALPEAQQHQFRVLIKADKNVTMEQINQLKTKLQEHNLYKISYGALRAES